MAVFFDPFARILKLWYRMKARYNIFTIINVTIRVRYVFVVGEYSFPMRACFDKARTTSLTTAN